MTTWLVRLDAPGDGPRLAVKDAIDVEGVPTTLACPVIGDLAEPAVADAPVVAAARAAGARIVGKTNLTELCRAADGVNPWTGTPVNPLDPRRVPGGSSSGSAVAVATGEADIALGTDTAGSVRVPAACCGITGLKLTHGSLPLDGVFPLAASHDVLGPIAPNIAALAQALHLMTPQPTDPERPLAPSEQAAASAGRLPTPPPDTDPEQALAALTEQEQAVVSVGRLCPAGVDIDPELDAAVDAALREAGLTVTDEPVPYWPEAISASNTLILSEGYRAHRGLLAYPDRISARIRRRIERGAQITDAALDQAYAARTTFRDLLQRLLERHQVLALPTLAQRPPLLGTERNVDLTLLTAPFNLSGHPALTLPIPARALPASLQLIAPPHTETRLLALAAQIESTLT